VNKLPGGALASRPLHFFYLFDCSGSMTGAKIQAANFAVREAVPEMRRVASENPNAQVLVRAIAFADGARWHVAQPTPVSSFQWNDMQAGGVTDMGKALRMVADVLTVEQMPTRGLPPVLVLLSDGRPTDDFNRGLKALMEQPWGKKAVRIAIAVGDDADLDVLQKFIGHGEIAPLQAHNANDLVNYIKWASTAVLQAASSPATQSAAPAVQAASGQVAAVNVPLPAPPAPVANDEDVW
jgi:uncharacterized protein YegL